MGTLSANEAGGPWEWVIQVGVDRNLTGPIKWTMHWQGGGGDPLGKWQGSTPPAGSDAAPSFSGEPGTIRDLI